jgi:hypothetical protein
VAAVIVPLAWAVPASAQQLTVQQPVFRTFSATTTVSVPDRGAAYLGGVGRAADSRSRFGPLPSGTNLGTAREHAGMNVGVWIHDFEEMDRRLLGSSGVDRSRPVLSGYAAHSYRSLHARQSTPGRPSVTRPASAAPEPAAKADRHYRLGVGAESRGSTSVARLHYRTAARYGSVRAQERLAKLDATAVAER